MVLKRSHRITRQLQWLALLLIPICSLSAAAQSRRMILIGTIGDRRVELFYNELHNDQNEWLAFEGDTLWYQLSITQNRDDVLVMEAINHNGEWRGARPIRAGRLEGKMPFGYGTFDGVWYGNGGDTARAYLEEVVYYHSVMISPFEGIESSWELPIFLEREHHAWGPMAARLNGELHRWMDDELARRIDSFRIAQINARREFEKDTTSRLRMGGAMPAVQHGFRVESWVSWCSSDLVSVLLDRTGVSGWRSRFQTYEVERDVEGWTYRIDSNAIRRVLFSDLFRQGADVRRVLFEWGKRNRNSRHPIDSAFIAGVDTAAGDAAYERIVRTFTIGPGSISFFVPEPDRPEKSSGYSSIEIPYRELEAIIDPDGPLARFVRKR